jgi:hypothetical protein
MSQNHFGKGDNVRGDKIINLVLGNKIVMALLLIFIILVSGYFYLSQKKSDVDLVDVKTPVESSTDPKNERNPDNVGQHMISDTIKTGESIIANKIPSEKKDDSQDQISSANTALSTTIPKANTSTLEVSESESGNFPEYTFILRNSGNLEGIISAFVVELLEVKIDSTPNIVFNRPFGSPAMLMVKNIGWGDARNFQYSFSNSPEFSAEDTSVLLRKPNTPWTITSGAGHYIYRVDVNEFKPKGHGLSDWLFDHIRNEYPLPVYYSYRGSNGDFYEDSDKILQEGPPSGMFSDISYISKFDISDGEPTQTKRYDNISRNIPANGSDIFSVMVGVKQSCSGRIRFKFNIDGYWVISEEFEYAIRNPIGSFINSKYQDGDQIINEVNR